MEFNTVRERFGIALYRWCREEFRREIGEGYPTLLSLKNDTARRTVEVMQSLALDRREAIMMAMLRWSHQRVLGLDQSTRNRDQNLFADFERRVDEIRRREAPPSDHNRAAVRRELKRRLREEARRLSDDGTVNAGPGGTLAFVKRMADFTLTTMVDLGGSLRDVSFRQHLSRQPREKLLENFSWPKGLGITSADEWTSIDLTNVPDVASGIVGVCERLIGAAPALLAEANVSAGAG